MQDEKFNSFSQSKGLLWKNKYDNIIKWEKKEEELLPPVGVTIDLTTACNLKCKDCIAWRSWNLKQTLKTEEVYEIINMLKSWKQEYKNVPNVLESICFAGGGEGSIHLDYDKIITYAHEAGFQIGVSTNGTTLINKDKRTSLIKHAEFTGVSMDAGSSEVWCDYKQVSIENWDMLLKGLKKFVEEWKNTPRSPRKMDLVFKFLITKTNQNDIVNACLLAKMLGFPIFYARPAALEGLEFYEEDFPDWDVSVINEQIKACKKLEDESFKVFVNFLRVRKKDYGKDNRFKKCHASPVILQICADGYMYMCLDTRYVDRYKTVKWDEVKTWWGSNAHRKWVFGLKPEKCIRCCFTTYNEQIERTIIGDDLYEKFP